MILVERTQLKHVSVLFNTLVVHYGRDEKRDLSLKKIKMTKKAIFNYTAQKDYSIFNLVDEEKNKSSFCNNNIKNFKLSEEDYMNYYKELVSKDYN